MECGPKCRSKEHAQLLHNAITKCPSNKAEQYLSTCFNSGAKVDQVGRSAWHVGASCGKLGVLQYLVENNKGDTNVKDKESGYTALHRAIFYGQLHCARFLISSKASLKVKDNEGLTPLDLAAKDRSQLLPGDGYRHFDTYDVYTWGNNSNFNLGHQGERSKPYPTVIENFRRKGFNLKQVAMSKYHTAFLTLPGQLYTCGHGRGGRLGHGDGNPTLEPRQVERLAEVICTEVKVARDHTLVLTQEGFVYGFGINDHYQLDQADCSAYWQDPKLVNRKYLTGKRVHKICAGRFHSVVACGNTVLTFGLNAGQLGHPQGEQWQKVPRVVSGLMRPGRQVLMLESSEAATAVVLNQGRTYTLYVLYRYDCRKLKRFPDLSSIAIQGGHLDHSVSPVSLKEKGGSDLCVAVSNTQGQVFLWKEGSDEVLECLWTVHRSIWVTDVSLSPTDLFIVTRDGQLFVSVLASAKRDNAAVFVNGEDYKIVKSPSGGDLTRSHAVYRLQARHVPGTRRCVSVTNDTNGNNLCVLQEKPHIYCLTQMQMDVPRAERNLKEFLSMADEYDGISDICLEVKGYSIPAHKYFLCSRSDYFNQLISSSSLEPESDTDDIDRLPLPELSYSQLSLILEVIYCDDSSSLSDTGNLCYSPSISTGVSRTSSRNSKKSKAAKKEDQRKAVSLKQSIQKYVRPPKIEKSSKKKHAHFREDLHDVTITSDDGVSLECHRCVLAAELPYFNSILSSTWAQGSTSKELSLPIPGTVLKCIIDFLYDDNDYKIKHSKDVEFVLQVMITADQLLMFRLKALCENALADFISLRNVSELLELSATYRADHLKGCCMRVVCLNLATLLETSSLDIVSDEVMEELTAFFRSYFPCMYRRVITPSIEHPTDDELEQAIQALHIDDVIGQRSSMRKPRVRRQRKRTVSSASSVEDISFTTESQPKGTVEDEQTNAGDFTVDTFADEFSDDEKSSDSKVRNLLSPTAVSSPVSSVTGGHWNNLENPVSPVLSPHRDSVLSTTEALRRLSMKLPSFEAELSVKAMKKKGNRRKRNQIKLDFGSCSAEPNGHTSKRETANDPNIKTAGVCSLTERSCITSTASHHLPADSKEVPTGSMSTQIPHPSTKNVPKPMQDVPLPSTPVSFKDIMDSQHVAANATSTKPKMTHKKGTKLSQKERKKLHTNSAGDAPAGPADKLDGANKPADTPPKKSPWGQSAVPTARPVPSLRDVMVSEAEISNRRELCVSPLSSPRGSGDRAMKSQERLFSPASPPPLWEPQSMAAVPALQDIMEREQKDRVALEQRSSKPLSLIQIEEKAMGELLDHYKSQKKYQGETIRVERIDRNPTAPNWAATTKVMK